MNDLDKEIQETLNQLGEQVRDDMERELELKINRVYAEAVKDIEEKLRDFTERYKAKEAIYRGKLKDGEITQEQYNNWLRGQLFQSKQWIAKRDQLTEVLYRANDLANQIIEGEKYKLCAKNANYMSYALEKKANINFGFELYDQNTVINLIRNNPSLLPLQPPKRFLKSKDKAWSRKIINGQVLQGIIQGERLDQIARRIARATGSRNRNQILTTARTAMTSAQNAGRQITLHQAEDKGIRVHKEWMSTLDEHTRVKHRRLDGQQRPTDQPFSIDGIRIMFPGDPQAPPSMTYNCRCTLVGDLDDYPEEYERYDNILGRPIENMTYDEWEAAKKGETAIRGFQAQLGAAKTVKEVNDLMNSQGWWRAMSSGQPYSYADLTGCDLDSAKSIAASYSQVFERYPKLKGKFTAPDARPSGMKDDTYAWCYIRSHGRVQVNPKRYSDWQGLVRTYEEDVKSNWHPFGTTAESIVVHELGHAIDGLLAQKGVLGGYTSSGEFRYASSSLKTTIMKRAAKENYGIWEAMESDKRWGGSSAVAKYVSRYATENNREWFAECFAEYITSADPRTVSRLFGEELEKLIERLPE